MAEFLEYPLAYHLTFGTYGTRLHGDERGTVLRGQNRFGEPIIGKDVVWKRLEQSQLKYPAVVLSDEQQRHVENVLAGVCERGGWEYHMAAGQPDHVHVMLTSPNDGKAIRKWLKTWLGQDLSKRWPLAPGQTRWAEGGSIRFVWNDEYFKNVFEYIRTQRTLRPRTEITQNRTRTKTEPGSATPWASHSTSFRKTTHNDPASDSQSPALFSRFYALGTQKKPTATATGFERIEISSKHVLRQPASSDDAGCSHRLRAFRCRREQ